MIIVGVGGTLGHDANAAVLVDGRLLAAGQQERYSRQKYDSAFPAEAIRDCLELAGAVPSDVAACIFADKPLQHAIAYRLECPSNWLTWQLGKLAASASFGHASAARSLMPRAKVGYAWHHLAHAALAFATSPYPRAAFLCVDGMGDDVNATIGIADSRRTEIRFELPYENGLGFLFVLVTEFLGFGTGAEYKVMGLAPYGDPVHLERLRSFADCAPHGAVRFNWNRQSWPAVLESLSRHLGLPARRSGDAITDDHANLAASIQSLFEEQIFAMAAYARQMTGERFLVFCGGCAQNCVVAGKLRGLGLFEDVFTSPAAGDMGTGLGAALLLRQQVTPSGDGKIDVAGLYLGSPPGIPPPEALVYQVPYDGDIFTEVALLLAAGNVIGWVRGRMELGARALGARSILADPRAADMQSLLNLKVKGRESFRPFAPAILAEDCSDWFKISQPSDYMQLTAYLKPEHRRASPRHLRGWRERLDFRRCDFPAVVHVDYSARLQTVRRDCHPDFHTLLTAFKKLTGLPFLVNTSFNLSGEPIVRTATDAWQCFRHTQMDYLVVEDLLLRHPNDTTIEEKRAWRKQFAESS